ncbi:MAG: molecular chaperone TorD family protein [Candidatus Latescibacteria bacterium]|nr:molecular chaperone TorD family protein [Candidatus Latescibacterota bacterium]
MSLVEVPALELALCRSMLYEALALGLCAPGPEVSQRLASAQGSSALAAAAYLIGPELAEQVRQLAAEAQAVQALPLRFRLLFGHTSRGPVPPYETEYGTDALFLQPQEMADISGFFRAFGLELDQRQHQRVDHIACECEFLAFLCRKEAYALEAEDEDMLEQTTQAQRLFLRDHLGRFGSAFGHRLAREDDGFYGILGRICAAFLEAECRLLDLPLGPSHLELRPAEPDNVPMACGNESELLEIEDPEEDA